MPDEPTPQPTPAQPPTSAHITAALMSAVQEHVRREHRPVLEGLITALVATVRHEAFEAGKAER